MSTGRPVVLIAALNWGLGHANRCIPLIRELDSLHCEVVIAGNGASHEILKIEFPEKQHISLPHYNIRYSDRSSLFILKMLFHLPRFLLSASRDFYATRRFIRQYKPALIISDNRYGFRSSQVYSVLLTHQVLPKTTFKSGLLKKLFRKAMFSLLKKFDEVWVPDFPGENNLS